MRVRIQTIMCGPNGSHNPGAVVDVPDEVGKALIEAHGAQALDKPVTKPSETATLRQEYEQRKGRRGKR